MDECTDSDCLLCDPTLDTLFQDNASEALAEYGVIWKPEIVF